MEKVILEQNVQRKLENWPRGCLENSKGRGDSCIKLQGSSLPGVPEGWPRGQCGWSQVSEEERRRVRVGSSGWQVA